MNHLTRPTLYTFLIDRTHGDRIDGLRPHVDNTVLDAALAQPGQWLLLTFAAPHTWARMLCSREEVLQAGRTHVDEHAFAPASAVPFIALLDEKLFKQLDGEMRRSALFYADVAGHA